MEQKYYIRVDVANYALSSEKTFWYSYDVAIARGSICEVSFGPRSSLGIVIECSNQKPTGVKGIKAISKVYDQILPLPEYLLEAAEWLKHYYVASAYSVWTTLLPSGIRAKARSKFVPPNIGSSKILNQLNNEQQSAYNIIMKSAKPTLLQGVTGSGKTEVYLHIIKDILDNNKSAILLVPEIMLTTQLAERLSDHFSNVIIVHSGLSVVERKKIWLYCLEHSKDESLVVVGPRSALWMPLSNLGLIIIDEEHESSYKQESFLRYGAGHVAGHIAKVGWLRLVLGSATPQISTTFLAEQGVLTRAYLKERHNSVLPEIEIVDKSEFNGSLSPSLSAGIDKALVDGKQTLLLLNRRGSASSYICKDCGHAAKCPNCDITLSFHGDIARLLCHYCGYSALPPTSCTECQGELKFVGSGTQKLFEEIEQSWPAAKVARLDRDNATWQGMQELYTDLRSGTVDIVVGTQMISRGLDIESLRLVGIVDADTSLAVPDFASVERTYQLLAQTAGRAGRRTELGKVVVQTRNPDHFAIRAAAAHDYEGFYRQELESRKAYAYPPYVYLLKLWYAHANALLAEQHARKLVESLKTDPTLKVLGPVPALQKRQNGKFVWQVIIKAKARASLTRLVISLPSGWQAELDPASVI